jgi:hypothetical protein
VFAGGEAGVDGRTLSEHLGLRTNGTGFPTDVIRGFSRNSFMILECVLFDRHSSDKFGDMEQFLKTEEYPVVLKPTESAGSGVTLPQL